MKMVLIAEDDAVTRRLIFNVVEQCGALPIAVSDGKTALDLLKCTPGISLVITDCVMPEMDGRELTRLIRGSPELSSLPIVVLSGFVKLAEIEDLLNLGASRFLPKPLDRAMLGDYIRHFLASESGVRSQDAASVGR